MGKRFEVSDNDFKNFSITPRIALSMKTPDSIEETFYVGKVSVILKESVFELLPRGMPLKCFQLLITQSQ